MSWDDELEGEEREDWDRFVRLTREHTLKAMDASAFVTQLIPSEEEFDVKFAVELGMAVMLGKPILAIVLEGRELSGKLRLVADEIVYADIDTEQGRQAVAAGLKRMEKHVEDGAE